MCMVYVSTHICETGQKLTLGEFRSLSIFLRQCPSVNLEFTDWAGGQKAPRILLSQSPQNYDLHPDFSVDCER